MSAYVTLAPRSVRGARERAPGGKITPSCIDRATRTMVMTMVFYSCMTSSDDTEIYEVGEI